MRVNGVSLVGKGGQRLPVRVIDGVLKVVLPRDRAIFHQEHAQQHQRIANRLSNEMPIRNAPCFLQQ